MFYKESFTLYASVNPITFFYVRTRNNKQNEEQRGPSKVWNEQRV